MELGQPWVEQIIGNTILTTNYNNYDHDDNIVISKMTWHGWCWYYMVGRVGLNSLDFSKHFHLIPVPSCLRWINKVLHQVIQHLPENFHWFPRLPARYLVRSLEANVAFNLEAASEFPLRPMWPRNPEEVEIEKWNGWKRGKGWNWRETCRTWHVDNSSTRPENNESSERKV